MGDASKWRPQVIQVVTFTGKPTDVEKHKISNIPLIRLDMIRSFFPTNQGDHFVGGNYKVGPGGAHFGGPRGPGRFRETRSTPWSNPNRCSSSCLQTSPRKSPTGDCGGRDTSGNKPWQWHHTHIYIYIYIYNYIHVIYIVYLYNMIWEWYLILNMPN